MQRINTLLQKINDLASKDKDAGVIDIDLMMDYTRVLYADLQEWRARVSFNTSLGTDAPQPSKPAIQPVQTGVAEKQENIVEEPVRIVNETIDEPITEQPVVNITKPAADIRKWIGINDKYQFISEMFGNDKDAYEMVMSNINESANYSSAIDMLDDVHAERGWNDEEITIQSFYGILSKFFSER